MNNTTEKSADKGHKVEEAINKIDEVSRYLVDLSSEPLSQKEVRIADKCLDSSRDLERIGDHGEALINLMNYIRQKVEFSPAALQELELIYNMALTFH